MEEVLEDGDADVEADDGKWSATAAESSRRRLGIRSPVDFRMAWRVCQPSVERSWNESARSCWLATLQSKVSSS